MYAATKWYEARLYTASELLADHHFGLVHRKGLHLEAASRYGSRLLSISGRLRFRIGRLQGPSTSFSARGKLQVLRSETASELLHKVYEDIGMAGLGLAPTAQAEAT